MASAWKAFDDSVKDQDQFFRSHVLKASARNVESKGCFMVAWSLSCMTDSMILVGRLEDARTYAELTEEYATVAIEREHSLVGVGTRLTTDMAKYTMSYAVYTSRWLLDGRESIVLIERMLEHATAALQEENKTRRKQSEKRAAQIALVGAAARLGDFNLARQYLPRTPASIDWSDGCTGEMCNRLLARVIQCLSCGNGHEAERTAVVQCYCQLFRQLRRGALNLYGGTHWQTAIKVAYYGMKYFEELRRGAPFTYEEVVRSIRYTPGSNSGG